MIVCFLFFPYLGSSRLLAPCVLSSDIVRSVVLFKFWCLSDENCFAGRLSDCLFVVIENAATAMPVDEPRHEMFFNRGGVDTRMVKGSSSQSLILFFNAHVPKREHLRMKQWWRWTVRWTSTNKLFSSHLFIDRTWISNAMSHPQKNLAVFRSYWRVEIILRPPRSTWSRVQKVGIEMIGHFAFLLM